ncbi:MAG TPA: class I SAM-dependent methyltransferase [Actinomycetota bacterium]|jgi:SAM-dependent methyltransferase
MDDWPDIRATYDAVAKDYAEQFDDELSRKPFDRDLLDRFAGLVRAGPVLDVGCGPAHVGARLAERGAAVTGLDLSGESVAEAARRHSNLTFVQGTMVALPVRDRSLAGIVAFYSVIHLPRTSVSQALAEMRRALRPEGHTLIAVHGGEGTATADDWFGHPVSVAATLFADDELPALAEAAGLRVDESIERDPYEFESQTRRLYLLASRPEDA